jgi:ATP-dependent Zn protease
MLMSLDSGDVFRASAAYHEAGHAVAAFRYRRTFERVELCPEGGGVLTGISTPEGDRGDPAVIERHVTYLYAGWAAVYVCLDPFLALMGLTQDKMHAQEFLSNLYGDAHQREMAEQRCRCEAVRIVEETKYAVKVLATALMEHRELSGDRARAIIEDALREPTA